jgi:hypothetical protein
VYGSCSSRLPQVTTREPQEATMPKSWSNKDERQYEHIKESYESRGRSESKAEELAARTVNKQRKDDGRTKSSKSKKKD